MIDLVIFGSGGFARETLQIVEDINAATPRFRFCGFLDGDVQRHGATVHGYQVLGGSGWLRANPGVKVAVAVGNPAARRRIVREIQEYPNGFATLIHPRAWVGRNVQIGDGSIICAMSAITTDIEVGSHVIVNIACTIGHDSFLEDFVTVLPGTNISGNVRLKEGADVGTGCRIIPGITVGEWSILGAGAVLAKDLPANVTAVGVPAKPIKERTRGWHEG